MGIPLRALIIEDSESDELLLLRELKRGGYDVTHRRIETAADMTNALDTQKWDIVISDYSLPQFDAPAALHLLQSKQIDLPFIIVSGTVGEDIAVASMKAGASDFFSKNSLQRLVPAIQREMRESNERIKRRWAELELRQSEERFFKAFNASPVGISISTASGLFLDINEHFLHLLGATRDQVIGHTSIELNIWTDAEERNRIGQQLQEMDHVYDIHTRFRTLSGDIREGLTSFELIELGGEMCVLTLVQDMTERWKAEDELRALYNATSYLFNADSLLSMGEQIVQAVLREFGQIDCGLMLVDKNQKRMIRLARGGEYAVQTEAPLYLDGPGLVVEAVRTEKSIYVPDVTQNSLYVSNNPTTRSELVVPLKTPQGTLGVLDLQRAEPDAFSQRDQRIVSAFAERAAAAIESMQLYEELNLRASELEWRVAQRTAELLRAKDRVEAILNNSSDAIILIRAGGLIQQVNSAFVQLFGYETDQALGQSLSEFVIEDQVEVLEKALQLVAETGHPLRIDMTARRQDGKLLFTEMALAPVTEYEGPILNVICNIRDITQRKQSEEELRNALEKEKELNELKSRFISTVSHEFRTPLSTILAASETIKEYSNRMTPESKVRHIDKIQNQVTRMTGLLNDVLTISRTETIGLKLDPMILDVDKFCKDIVEEMRTIAGTHLIRYEFSGETRRINADEELLRRITINLLSNAIKYSSGDNPVDMEVIHQGEKIIFRVRDYGIGIPDEDQKHLFEIFHRASNVGTIQGTGLGLAIVKRAVDAHNGTISFESVVGKGTTFEVEIPVT